MLNRIILITLIVFLVSCNTNKEQLKVTYPKYTYNGVKELFSKYKCSVQLSKLSVKLDKKSYNDWKRFKTRITEGSKKPVNFGGKYIIVRWGCGTECQTGAIIDASTGIIYRIPTSERGLEFIKSSLLLIVNPPSKNLKENKRPKYAYPAYYVWKNNKFELLHDMRK